MILWNLLCSRSTPSWFIANNASDAARLDRNDADVASRKAAEPRRANEVMEGGIEGACPTIRCYRVHKVVPSCPLCRLCANQNGRGHNIARICPHRLFTTAPLACRAASWCPFPCWAPALPTDPHHDRRQTLDARLPGLPWPSAHQAKVSGRLVGDGVTKSRHHRPRLPSASNIRHQLAPPGWL